MRAGGLEVRRLAFADRVDMEGMVAGRIPVSVRFISTPLGVG